MRQGFFAFSCCVLISASTSRGAQAQDIASVSDLGRLSIDELANLPVTGVTRTAQPLSQSPAAVYVITNEDIHRSGATTLAEALRLAPNLHVARQDASNYGISARGFNHNSGTANKLQVMIDGRIVYTPLYSGVFWDQQDVPLADIDRIEVISGPAGAAWGSNAVNGVINIVTRNARETTGTLVDMSAGRLDQVGTARYGSRIGENGALRVYVMGLNHGPLQTPAGADAFGAWDKAQVGFRSDWALAQDEITVQGDLYKGTTEDQAGTIQNNSVNGGNLLSRWVRNFSDQSSLQAQFYYWSSERRTITDIDTTVNGYDFDTQYAFDGGVLGKFLIGGGYRTSQDRFRPGPHTVFLHPARRTLAWGNGFIQDQIPLGSDLTLTLGLKAENNSYTGMEYMPDTRIAWRPFGADMIWGSISRAVRTPSRFDRDLRNAGVLAGGPDFDSEDLVAYEIGYRTQPTRSSSLSVSAFYNVYDNLRTVEASTPAIFPLVVSNNMKGETFGIEAWGSYALADWWRINAGLSTLHKNLRLVPGNRDVFGVQFAGNDPAYQVMLRSSMDLPGDLQFDLDLRAIDDLPSPRVPGYFEANARLGWRITKSLEIAIVGTNLFHARHTEFINPSIPAQEIPRSLSGTMRWLF